MYTIPRYEKYIKVNPSASIVGYINRLSRLVLARVSLSTPGNLGRLVKSVHPFQSRKVATVQVSNGGNAPDYNIVIPLLLALDQREIEVIGNALEFQV